MNLSGSGAGAVIDRLAAGSTAVHILCYTHGEASSLNETRADLHRARESELRQAAAELGAASVTLLDYPDGRLAGISPDELAAHAAASAAGARPDGLLIFDDTRITGHPDHRAATAAAVLAGQHAGLPVLARALPRTVADQLKAGTGSHFAGHDRPARAGQQEPAAARTLLHASRVSPGMVLWRRLQLQGECEHLRWLVPQSPRLG